MRVISGNVPLWVTNLSFVGGTVGTKFRWYKFCSTKTFSHIKYKISYLQGTLLMIFFSSMRSDSRTSTTTFLLPFSNLKFR